MKDPLDWKILGGGGGANQRVLCGGGMDIFWKHTLYQASVVQRLDSTIHRINHHPADSAISFPNTDLLDSDLSSG